MESNQTDKMAALKIFQVIYEQENLESFDNNRYTSIRVESTEYDQQPAIAVYFEEMTKQVELMRVEK